MLDVVKKEMQNMRNDAEEKHEKSMGWTTFEDDENLHPNLSAHHDVLDVVKKEMQNMQNDAEEKHENSMGWTTFEDDENLHPNLSVHHDNSLHGSSFNPFSHGYAQSKWN